MPRTDRRPRQRLDAETRRAAILRAAADAFIAQPYDKVSVARVAAAANASEALVHRYFGSKSGLYLAVSRAGVTALLDRQRQALEAAPADAPARLTATVRVYLDTVAEWSQGWLNPFQPASGEPAESLRLRRESRDTYATLLRDLLDLPADSRLDYAVYGYLSFLDAACLRWAERNYPPEDREPITDQAVAALAGALAAAGHPHPGLAARQSGPVAPPSRQGACLQRVLGRLGNVPAVEVGVLVGSLAAGRGDPVSDIDLLVFVSDGAFDVVWSGRHQMPGPDAVACWDEVDPQRPGVGAFRWVGSDGVLVEMLIAEVGSGVRVASPAVVVVGDAAVFQHLPRRPPIRREDLGQTPRHPVEAAYDTFKQVARAAGCHAADGVDSPPR